jgi:hypothetical protein
VETTQRRRFDLTFRLNREHNRVLVGIQNNSPWLTLRNKPCRLWLCVKRNPKRTAQHHPRLRERLDLTLATHSAIG